MIIEKCRSCSYYVKNWGKCDLCLSVGCFGNNEKLASDLLKSSDTVCKYYKKGEPSEHIGNNIVGWNS